MQKRYINILLELEGIFIKKIVPADSYTKIYIETEAKPHILPCCRTDTHKIHDDREPKKHAKTEPKMDSAFIYALCHKVSLNSI